MIKIFLVSSLITLAHSWYPKECCSDKDCAPLPAYRVQVLPSGYRVDNRWHISHSAAKISPDNDYHACMMPGVAVRCFWAPRGMM